MDKLEVVLVVWVLRFGVSVYMCVCEKVPIPLQLGKSQKSIEHCTDKNKLFFLSLQ